MEAEMMSNVVTSRDGDDEDVPLPGFRFHPTDEELVRFYLRRKIEKRPISIEIIKQIDIYKYDPWDLPKGSNVGDREWYFYCKRGRKYRNSVRPNRVTGSGFWKATGIDRPIYSAGGDGRDCIGLKKSLVYYRGSAGKGTKTDWMMHEFRLPADLDRSTKHVNAITIAQEAEVWTLCRIFKRNAALRKCIPDIREQPYAKRNPVVEANSQTGSAESVSGSRQSYDYVSFSEPIIQHSEKKPLASQVDNIATNHFLVSHCSSTKPQVSSISCPSGSYSTFMCPADINDFLLRQDDWEDLRSAVHQFASGHTYLS